MALPDQLRSRQTSGNVYLEDNEHPEDALVDVLHDFPASVPMTDDLARWLAALKECVAAIGIKN